jgi:hypothetical protein
VTGPADGSADAILTGSAAGTDGADAAATGADEALAVAGTAGADAALAVAALPEMVAASTGPLPVSAGLEIADRAVELAVAGSLEAGGLVAAANGPLVLSPGFTSTA